MSGFPGGSAYVESLDAVRDIKLTYKTMKIPCKDSWIEVKPGEIGRINKLQEEIDSFEIWFWFLGLSLALIKLLELIVNRSISEKLTFSSNQNQKRRRGRKHQ